MIVNKTEVPSTQEEDVNKGKTLWKDGKCIALDEGSHMTYFIAHEKSVRQEQVPTEDGSFEFKEVETTIAYPIRTEKPATRDSLINAAEMAAYHLSDAMAVASFTASMARKFREDATDAEVAEHDEFIAWVKTELTKIGV
jgi:hypothetical protein